MKEPREIDPGHRGVQRALRVVGPVLALIGIALMAVALAAFFASWGKFEMPRLQWCAPLGMFLLFIGAVLSMFSFMGAVVRYQAEEVAPVAKDTFNYLAEGTKEGVETVAEAIGKGLAAASSGGQAAKTVVCPGCRTDNAPDARFCDHCGLSIRPKKACPACNDLNDADAGFCDHCGRRFD